MQIGCKGLHIPQNSHFYLKVRYRPGQWAMSCIMGKSVHVRTQSQCIVLVHHSKLQISTTELCQNETSRSPVTLICLKLI